MLVFPPSTMKKRDFWISSEKSNWTKFLFFYFPAVFSILRVSKSPESLNRCIGIVGDGDSTIVL